MSQQFKQSITRPYAVNLQTHLLNGVRYVQSENCDERPQDGEIGLVVIHGISLPPGKFGGQGVEQLFTNQLNPKEDPYYETIAHLKVSAHLFIDRRGEITQFVPFNKRAWHAGVSRYQGRDKCNDFSIGIELEGTDFTPYTASQYESLKHVVQALFNAYPSISKDAVTGHEHIAPGRKNDPGPYFMWSAIRAITDKG